jgi:hypothetical protein
LKSTQTHCCAISTDTDDPSTGRAATDSELVKDPTNNQTISPEINLHQAFQVNTQDGVLSFDEFETVMVEQ